MDGYIYWAGHNCQIIVMSWLSARCLGWICYNVWRLLTPVLCTKEHIIAFHDHALASSTLPHYLDQRRPASLTLTVTSASNDEFSYQYHTHERVLSVMRPSTRNSWAHSSGGIIQTAAMKESLRSNHSSRKHSWEHCCRYFPQKLPAL